MKERQAGDLLVCRLVVVVGDLDVVLELHAAEHVGDELVAVESVPALLRGVEQLEAIACAAFLDPAPFVTRVRSLTVAKLDSIAWEVRR